MARVALGVRIDNAQRAVKRAVMARDIHAGECADWDYENGGCLECQDHDNAVKRARDAVRALEVK